MKFGHRIHRFFEKYARWWIIAASIMLLSGFFLLAGRNLLVLWFLSENKLNLLSENYAAAFKLQYAPVQYLQRFVRIWAKNIDSLQVVDRDVLQVFNEAQYFRYVTFVDEETLEAKPDPGHIIWDDIEIIHNSPFLELIYCFESKGRRQYLKMELPFEKVSLDHGSINGFALITNEKGNHIIAGISQDDWNQYTQYLVYGNKILSLSEEKKLPNQITFGDIKYLIDEITFTIDESVFSLVICYNGESLTENTDILFLIITVLLPLFACVILLVVIFPRIRNRWLFSDSQLLQLIARGESENLEFKSSLRWDYEQNVLNKDLENVVLKSIAAFTNARGGRLVIGVSDEGRVLGLEKDFSTLKEPNTDYFELHLRNLIDTIFGRDFSARQIRCKFHTFTEEPNSGKQIVLVDIDESDEPIYVTLPQQGAKSEKFFVRSGNSSRALESLSEVSRYIKKRF